LESASLTSSPSVGRFPSKRFIFNLVRYQPGGVSRADLARQTGLVREQMQGYRASNRKPVLLEINPAKSWVVGIDMGDDFFNKTLENAGLQLTGIIAVGLGSAWAGRSDLEAPSIAQY
jgi:hypothetical protein